MIMFLHDICHSRVVIRLNSHRLKTIKARFVLTTSNIVSAMVQPFTYSPLGSVQNLRQGGGTGDLAKPTPKI